MMKNIRTQQRGQRDRRAPWTNWIAVGCGLLLILSGGSYGSQSEPVFGLGLALFGLIMVYGSLLGAHLNRIEWYLRRRHEKDDPPADS